MLTFRSGEQDWERLLYASCDLRRRQRESTKAGGEHRQSGDRPSAVSGHHCLSLGRFDLQPRATHRLLWK